MEAKCEKVYPSPGLPFCFQKRIGRRLHFHWHYHHEYEITLITRGRGQLFVGSTVTDYEGMSLVLIGPDISHAFASDMNLPAEYFESVIIQFSRERIGLEQPSKTDFLPVYRLFRNAQGGLLFSQETAQAVLNIIPPLEEDSGLPGLIDLLKIINLLSSDNSSKILCANSEFSVKQSDDMSEIEKVRQFIFQNYYEDITLSDAAAVANLSVSSFCRFFRKNLNTTFVKYLTAIRISAACKYLIQTDMPINSICFLIGFNNLSNFNRKFFEEKKLTPRQYRKKYRTAKSIGREYFEAYLEGGR